MRRLLCSRWAGLAALGAWLALTPAARAVDGVLEISQACVQTGCFPGDTPGFPVTLRTGASYRLTSDLVTSGGDVTAIEGVVSGSQGLALSNGTLALDLNGFAVRCFVSALVTGGVGGSCTGTGAVVDGIGVDFSGVTGAAVYNGSVREMGSSGIVLGPSGRAHRVQAIRNRLHGIVGAEGITISESTADSNVGTGLGGRSGSVVIDSVSLNNGLGIVMREGAVVARNAVYGNSDGGIFVESGSLVIQNSINRNGGFGLSGEGTYAWGHNALGIRSQADFDKADCAGFEVAPNLAPGHFCAQ
jgi:hypothetical protein